MLVISNIFKSLPSENENDATEVVLAGLSFSVDKGSILAIVGKSGAGKTTLLRLIAGLDPVDRGTIKFFDNGNSSGQANHGSYAAGEENMTQIATLVFQHYRHSMFPWQTAKQALKWSCRATDDQEKRNLVGNIAAKLALDQPRDLLEKRCMCLAGGQMQRLAIGRALAAKSRLLLMDEPHGSLDAYNTEQIQDMLLKEKLEDPDLTIIISTHDLREAVYLGNKVIVLKRSGNAGAQVSSELLIPKPIDQRNQEWTLEPDFNQIVRDLRKTLG